MALFPDKESVTLELKRELPEKLTKIYRTVIGFANRFGGQIIIGIADSGEIIGINENDAHEILEILGKSIYESCVPAILPQLCLQRIEDKTVVVIEVSPGNQKPYYIKSLGITEGIFIRTGRSTVKATPQVQDELIWSARGKSPDSRPMYDTDLSYINIKAFNKFLSQRKQQSEKVEELLALRNYGIVTQDQGQDIPTLGGLLLFGEEPQALITEAFLIVTEYEGTKGRNIRATKDCTGSLFAQYSSAYEFILSKLEYSFVISSRKRKEVCEIPEIAIREVLVNAIVHRNYQIQAPTKVSVYQDRVEIFSPGSFPGPLDSSCLKAGLTYIRNACITRTFREAGLIEKLGSGFITLFDSYSAAGLPEPRVESDGEYVKCILPRYSSVRKGKKPLKDKREPTKTALPLSSNPSKQKNPLTAYVKRHKEFNTQDIVQSHSISRQTAVRHLTSLILEGILERVGKGPSTRYIRK
jgi:ATP-dependent DNA helicase RecG